MNSISDIEKKICVANYAINYLLEKDFLHSNIKIGLGTGSTATEAIKQIANLLKKGTLKNIFACSSSFQTTLLCEKLGISVYSINSSYINGELDFTIDGADEIDNEKNLTKGGGAALLQEKILAYNSKNYFIIATKEKKVENLGLSFPIPIEIIPEARISCIRDLTQIGAKASLREGIKKMGPVVTDNGNFIVDASFVNPFNPKQLEEKIKLITGVVEVGLFTKKEPIVFIVDNLGNCERF